MNPLLGTGGNAGKRFFDKGWKFATQDIESPPKKIGSEILIDDLEAYLTGDRCKYLGQRYNAASWFGMDNKMYNHGTKSSREGGVSPWAMVLACEGLIFFAGSTSRQLGSRSQPKGAFPFVTSEMAPKSAGDAGRVEAEMWLPIWTQPTTVIELENLFLRGRTEIQGRGATSSVEFTVGIINRGVDTGVTEFRRFLLMHTTSDKTFESTLASSVPIPKEKSNSATTNSIRTIIDFNNTLPRDRKKGQRWEYFGIRGPIEQALVNFATRKLNENRVEQAWDLVDKMAEALTIVDHNSKNRRNNIRFRLLPGQWASDLFLKEPPDREARLALAISSMYETCTSSKFIAYRIGVEREGNNKYWRFPDAIPARRVWSNSDLVGNLNAIAQRRVLEALQNTDSQSLPFDAFFRVSLDDVHAWVSGDVDEGRVELWLNRLSLFDWKSKLNIESAKELQLRFTNVQPSVDGMLVFHALFRPLLSQWLFHKISNESQSQNFKNLTCSYISQIIPMLQNNELNLAVELAISAYHSAGVYLANFEEFPTVPDLERLITALIIPVQDHQVLSVFQRWRTPTHSNE